MSNNYGVKGKIIFEMLKDGKSSKEIMETVGCTKSTISHYRSKLNDGGELINIVDRSEVMKLIEQGLTTNQIAEKMNCDRSTISRICRKYNIEHNSPDVVYKYNPTKEEFLELLNNYTVKEIAKMNNVTVQTIYNKKKSFDL